MPDIFDLTDLRVPEGQTAIDIQRRLRKGHGELVTVHWTDLDAEMNPVERTTKYYIGKATMGQTGTIVAVIAAVFANGAELKEITGRRDNLLFLNALDEANMAVLLGAIMGETEDWVKENFDLTWLIDVAVTFFKYNDFFVLVQKALDLMEKWGWTTDKVRAAVTGQAE
jgi:hypothetical protein